MDTLEFGHTIIDAVTLIIAVSVICCIVCISESFWVIPFCIVLYFVPKMCRAFHIMWDNIEDEELN